MEAKPNSIALDIGSGYSKWAVGDRIGVMRSAVGCYRSQGFDDTDRAKSIVRYKNGAYLFGDRANDVFSQSEREKTLSREWAFAEGYMALIYGCISQAFPNGLCGDLAVCTGLPQAYFRARKNEFKKRVSGKHTFRVDDTEYDFEISSLFVVPQAMALYYAAASQDRALLKDLVATVDVGTFTSGFAMTENSRFKPYASHGIELGISSVAEQLQAHVVRHHAVEISLAQAIKAVERGKIRIAGKSVQLGRVIPTFVEQLADQLLEPLIKVWSEDGQTAQIIVGGGGGPLFLPVVRHRFKHAELASKRQDDCWKMVVLGYKAYLESHLNGK